MPLPTWCSSRNRLVTKANVQSVLQIPVDTTQLPSGSLDGHTLEFLVKRTLTQVGYNIYLTGGLQLLVVNNGASSGQGTVQLTLSLANLTGIQSGDYYWEFRAIQVVSQSVIARPPYTSYGELIILDSL